jgi:hypothetical protein
MTPPRHLLLIASQCLPMGDLPDLEPVARELHDALRDPEAGGCAPGLPDGRSLIVLRDGDPDGTAERIERTFHQAVTYAADRRATLVVVLAGHGFVPGDLPTLYFMAPTSRYPVRDSAVDVPRLLTEAADRPGIAGVIAVVDTCHAAAARPATAELAAGVRRGRASLAVIMASLAGQEARELRLSRQLADILRRGVATSGPLLYAEDVHQELGDLVIGQDPVVGSTYTGRGRRDMWLSANRASPTARSAMVADSLGVRRLNDALRAAGMEANVERCDTETLRMLRDATAKHSDPVARRRLHGLIDNLRIATLTARLLRSPTFSRAVTTDRLRAAAAGLHSVPGGSLIRIPQTAFSDLDALVEHLAVNHPVQDGDCRTAICCFVVALARITGADPHADPIKEWVSDISAEVHYNNAERDTRDTSAERRHRLVVSLHASIAGDWPAMLEAWLLDGDRVADHEVFGRPEGRPGQAETELALAAAVEWAEERLPGGPGLEQIEIAAPSTLLLRWRAEETEVHGSRLGADYDVVLRWSQRLNPPAHLRWIRDKPLKRWEQIERYRQGAPVHWLGPRDTGDRSGLRDQLVKGGYPLAIALDHVPGDHDGEHEGADLLDLLLAYSPILLWPDCDEKFTTEQQHVVEEQWHALPTGITYARRKAWQSRSEAPIEPSGDPPALVQAVWDDRPWLALCRVLQPMPPVLEEGPK